MTAENRGEEEEASLICYQEEKRKKRYEGGKRRGQIKSYIQSYILTYDLYTISIRLTRQYSITLTRFASLHGLFWYLFGLGLTFSMTT